MLSLACAVDRSPGCCCVTTPPVTTLARWVVVVPAPPVEADCEAPRERTNVSLLPSGSSLSVSRSMSFTFLSSVSQKRLREVLVTVSVELFALLGPVAVVPATAPEITWVAMPTVSLTSRVMFT